MRKLVRNALVTGATAAAAVALAAAPASADAGWIITPEGDFTAVSTDSKLTNGSATLQCAKVTAKGQVFSSDSNHVGNITSSTWENCTGPFGLTFGVQQVGVWTINANNPNSSGGIDGEIGNITANISGPLCTATVTGKAHGTYDNAGTLTINEPAGGDLVVTSASCLGVLNPGDRPSFTATFAVTPAFVATPA